MEEIMKISKHLLFIMMAGLLLVIIGCSKTQEMVPNLKEGDQQSIRSVDIQKDEAVVVKLVAKNISDKGQALSMSSVAGRIAETAADDGRFYIYQNGSHYIGDLKNGLPNGTGTRIFQLV